MDSPGYMLQMSRYLKRTIIITVITARWFKTCKCRFISDACVPRADCVTVVSDLVAAVSYDVFVVGSVSVDRREGVSKIKHDDNGSVTLTLSWQRALPLAVTPLDCGSPVLREHLLLLSSPPDPFGILLSRRGERRSEGSACTAVRF